MVLESLISPFKAEKKPWELFFLGFLYSSIALFLANWIFKEYASLIMVFLTVVASLPLMVNSLKREEKKDFIYEDESRLIKEHSKTIFFITFLFLGFVASFVTWYVILPNSFVQSTFQTQTLTIQSINSQVTGNYSAAKTFLLIFLNNLKVLIFCILFSFLYGAGAIFILTWNASVIATAIGNYIRTNLVKITSQVGLQKIASHFQIISLGLLRYFIHGIPEMSAYFIAGLAGGIISVAVIRENFGTRRFEKIILDSSDLILLAVFVLFIAALIEILITPALF